jgi:UrcA family protein
MSRIIFAMLAVTAILASSSAQAQFRQKSVAVFYGDLDLSKPAGMQTLRVRLKAASLQVCGDVRGALKLSSDYPAHCAQDAMTNALDAIGKAKNRMVAENSTSN